MKINLQSGNSAKFTENDGLYTKEVIKFGTYVDKYNRDAKLVLDKKMAEEMIANFNDAYPDIDLRPEHYNHDALKVLGWVRNLTITKRGLDAEIDVISESAQEAIEDGRLRNVSSGIIFNNVDNETNKETGARLEHVAFVSQPYLRGMKPFAKLDENSAESLYVLEDEQEPVDEPTEPDTIKDMNKVDSKPEDKKSNEQDIDTRIEQLEAERFELKVKTAYAELLSEGKIAPAYKEAFFKASNDGELELAVSLFSAAPIADMPKINEEQGTDEAPEKDEDDVEKEEAEAVSRLGVDLDAYKKYGEEVDLLAEEREEEAK